MTNDKVELEDLSKEELREKLVQATLDLFKDLDDIVESTDNDNTNTE